mgnify:CR=1 FL=1
MQLILDPPTLDRVRPSTVTIGVFDGVHLGHRHLISHAVRRAQLQGIRSVAITFDPHPRAVLAKGEPVQYLTDLAERSRLIREVGIDVVATLKFTPVVAGLTAEAFMEEVKARLGLIELWVGPDFALGRARHGTVPVLRAIGAQMGFTVNTVEPLVLEGVVVSSSTIRKMLSQGDVEAAARLLGRPYALEGVVRHGDHRGRLLGFPTANLDLDPSRVTPEDGVYVAVARLPNGTLPAVANIGVRPSFGPGNRGLEVHVLDFSGDLYGQHIRVEFLHRLRPEVRFASVVDLQAQIRRDAEAAREYVRGLRSI